MSSHTPLISFCLRHYSCNSRRKLLFKRNRTLPLSFRKPWEGCFVLALQKIYIYQEFVCSRMIQVCSALGLMMCQRVSLLGLTACLISCLKEWGFCVSRVCLPSLNVLSDGPYQFTSNYQIKIQINMS